MIKLGCADDLWIKPEIIHRNGARPPKYIMPIR